MTKTYGGKTYGEWAKFISEATANPNPSTTGIIVDEIVEALSSSRAAGLEEGLDGLMKSMCPCCDEPVCVASDDMILVCECGGVTLMLRNMGGKAWNFDDLSAMMARATQLTCHCTRFKITRGQNLAVFTTGGTP